MAGLMFRKCIAWGGIVALLLMSSGVVQWAHQATDHHPAGHSHLTGAHADHHHHHTHHPVTPSDHHPVDDDCGLCHLIHHFAGVPLIAAPLSVPLALQSTHATVAAQQPTLSVTLNGAGPRAPPVHI